MPTGYTAGIMDGDIKTFGEFAKKCMRAFGATIHMREESLDVEYRPRTPDSFYYESLERAKKNVADLDNLPDAHFVELEYEEIKSEISRMTRKIMEIKEAKARLELILSDAEKWTPPTKEHEAFKEFMISQLTSTIDRDCSVEYYEEGLEEYYKRLDSPIDVELVKERLRGSYEYNIEYRQKSLDDEIERCKESNDWAEKLLKSINK